MADHPQPAAPEAEKPAPHRWVNTLVVSAISSIALLFLLELISLIGAKEWVHDVAKDTAAALKGLSPLDMAHRFGAHMQDLAYRARGPSASSATVAYVPIAFVLLVKDIFGESLTRAIVDLMQLGAGLAAAIAVLVRFKFLNEILYPVLSLPLLAIAFTCLFSALMLVVMLFVASVVGEVLPDKISLASFGGLWSGVLVMCSGRTVEAGLHQAIDGVVERIVTRR